LAKHRVDDLVKGPLCSLFVIPPMIRSPDPQRTGHVCTDYAHVGI
jgi:hypothetical protein